MTRTKLSPKAEAALMKAEAGKGAAQGFLIIKRTLGALKRKDVAELYEKGLIQEWFNPWASPCVLTKDGEKAFYARKGNAP